MKYDSAAYRSAREGRLGTRLTQQIISPWLCVCGQVEGIFVYHRLCFAVREKQEITITIRAGSPKKNTCSLVGCMLPWIR
jgi:hypothetical protein